MRANPENEWLSSIVVTMVLSLVWIGFVPVFRVFLSPTTPSIGENVLGATVAIMFVITASDVLKDVKAWFGKRRRGGR